MTVAVPGKHELDDANGMYGIGIDTGGTYTDSVIVELSSGTVVSKAKALTTHGNLGIGIENSLSQLDHKLFRLVGLVATPPPSPPTVWWKVEVPGWVCLWQCQNLKLFSSRQHCHVNMLQ